MTLNISWMYLNFIFVEKFQSLFLYILSNYDDDFFHESKL